MAIRNTEAILLRLPKELKEKIERVAKNNLRSVNKQLEKMILDIKEGQ